jgi:hypothetical protein
VVLERIEDAQGTLAPDDAGDNRPDRR